MTKFKKGNLVEVIDAFRHREHIGTRFVINETANSAVFRFDTDVEGNYYRAKGERLWHHESHLKLVKPDEACDQSFTELMLNLNNPVEVK